MSTTTKTQTFNSQGSKVQFTPEQTFDAKSMRHYLNGEVSVLHCHHYASLFTQLACDADQFNGPTLLCEATAEAFGPALRQYYEKNNVTEIPDRIAVAEQYFSFAGMGEVEFDCWDSGATVTMKHSHVDEGWVKKFGQRAERVNYMGEGYIKAAMWAIWNKGSYNDYQVEETQSIVSGAASSRFNVKW